MSAKPELTAFEKALEAAQPSEAQRIKSCLTEAHATIERFIERKVPLRLVVQGFNTSYSLNVSIARFRQLLKAERAARGQTLADRFPKKVA